MHRLTFILLGLVIVGVGALAIGLGLPNYQFGLGNTLIIAGTIAITGGLLLLAAAAILAQLHHLSEVLQGRKAAAQPALKPGLSNDHPKTGGLGVSELIKRASEPMPRASDPGPAPEVRPQAAAAGAKENPNQGPQLLKSGIVDGLAYSLYSDGTIEAVFPEGMRVFHSIEELQAYLTRAS